MQPKYEQIQFKIELGLEQIRLDRALSQHPSVRTRSRAARLLDQGLVWFAGKKAKASYITQHGDTFEIHLPLEASSAVLTPLALPLDVIHEDLDLIVVNKPAGLVVHPAVGHQQDTLVNALIHHTPHLSMGFNEKRPGIVHRLDKDTSGLIVVAKNDRAHEHLSGQFRSREVHRVYWAIVFGQPKSSEGRIHTRLNRHPKDRKRFASVRNQEDDTSGKLAVTNYKVLESSNTGLTLVELKLETGRTHQIRVHLSELSHPIVGDSLYGGDGRVKGVKAVPLRRLIEAMERFALHATELGFRHPTSGEWLSFKAPCPVDLLALVQACEFQL